MEVETASDETLDKTGLKGRIPALIFASSRTGAEKVGRLTLLDRLVVAIHRAGAGPITIVSEADLPELKRSHALGISIQVAPQPPRIDGAVLLASSELLVQTGDVRRCIESGARLVSRDGTALPLGLGASSEADIELALLGLPVIRAEGIAASVTTHSMARAAERELWASLTSSSDGIVDKLFNRRCGRPLSKLLIGTPVSPNMVSIASVVIGVISALFFAAGSHRAAVVGAILFQLSAIVDCVDGDIARMVFKESPLGKWLDFVGDQVVHVSVFAGIGVGVYRAGEEIEALWLGAITVAGAIISFLVVLRGMRQAAQSGLLQRLIKSATNRDFSVLVLLLACFQRLDWFLWLSAIGSHLFWIIALILQPRLRPARAIG